MNKGDSARIRHIDVRANPGFEPGDYVIVEAVLTERYVVVSKLVKVTAVLTDDGLEIIE